MQELTSGGGILAKRKQLMLHGDYDSRSPIDSDRERAMPDREAEIIEVSRDLHSSQASSLRQSRQGKIFAKTDSMTFQRSNHASNQSSARPEQVNR